MIVRIVDNVNHSGGRLADAELHFEPADGVLSGLKLIGFAVWERPNKVRTVTFPCRQYTVNGDRRSFALLRPITELAAHDRIRAAILDAYAQYEKPFTESTVTTSPEAVHNNESRS